MIEITNEDNVQLMARYPNKHFDLAIIDPPYGIGESNRDFNSRADEKYKKIYTRKNWDSEPCNKDFFLEVLRVSKNQIIWGANHFIENIPNANSPCWLVWDKHQTGDFADCELAWTSFKTTVRKFDFMWNGYCKQEKEERIHPTQKPVALYKWILSKYAKEGDKILDTNLGSGSIAIACLELNFDLTACEIDKEYFDLCTKRISEFEKQMRLF